VSSKESRFEDVTGHEPEIMDHGSQSPSFKRDGLLLLLY